MKEYTDILENRSIALLGNPNICRCFYLQYRTELNIQYIFSTKIDYTYSYSVNKVFSEQVDLKYAQLREADIRKKNIFMILCIEHEFRKNYDELLYYLGFEWGEDYIDYLYVIQTYKYRFDIELKNKNIWIFGAGSNGKKFYDEYKNIYNICGFISNFKDEMEFQNLPVIRLNEVLEKKNCYIVICSYWDIMMSEQLQKIGKKGLNDYGFVCMLPKKLFVAIGTCQIAYTTELLCKNIYFKKQFDSQIYFENKLEPCFEPDNKRLKKYGEFCDVVFYNVMIAESSLQRNYDPIIKNFYKKAKRMVMPFYSFRGQLMQATDNVNPYTLKIIKGNVGYCWWCGDREINYMLEAGEIPDKILNKISKSDYWPKQKIIDYFAKELKKVEVWDRFSTFPIKEYIEKNYKTQLIFIDGIHFSIYLGFYLANEIAKALDISKMHISEIINDVEKEPRSIMPIYPCVQQTLEINIKNEYKFYNIEKNELEYLKFEEYVKRYIRYVSDIRNAFSETGTFYR